MFSLDWAPDLSMIQSMLFGDSRVQLKWGQEKSLSGGLGLGGHFSQRKCIVKEATGTSLSLCCVVSHSIFIVFLFFSLFFFLSVSVHFFCSLFSLSLIISISLLSFLRLGPMCSESSEDPCMPLTIHTSLDEGVKTRPPHWGGGGLSAWCKKLYEPSGLWIPRDNKILLTKLQSNYFSKTSAFLA